MEYWAPGLAAAGAATGGCGSKGAAAARRRRTCVKGAQAEKENRQEALGAQAVSGAGPARGQQQDAERERVLGLARGQPVSKRIGFRVSLGGPVAEPPLARGLRSRKRRGRRVESVHQRLPGLV